MPIFFTKNVLQNLLHVLPARNYLGYLLMAFIPRSFKKCLKILNSLRVITAQSRKLAIVPLSVDKLLYKKVKL